LSYSSNGAIVLKGEGKKGKEGKGKEESGGAAEKERKRRK